MWPKFLNLHTIATRCLSSHQSHINLSNKTIEIIHDPIPQREEQEHPQEWTNIDLLIILLILSIFSTRKEIKDTKERKKSWKGKKGQHSSKWRGLSQQDRRDSTSLSSKLLLKSSNTELKEMRYSKILLKSNKLPHNLRTIKLKTKLLTLWHHQGISQALLLCQDALLLDLRLLKGILFRNLWVL
jgi:hypothetical protein